MRGFYQRLIVSAVWLSSAFVILGPVCSNIQAGETQARPAKTNSAFRASLGLVNPKITKAVLRGDWAKLYRTIDSKAAAQNPILDFIQRQACLCLNETCPGEGTIPELIPVASDQSQLLGWISTLIDQHPDNPIPLLLAGLANSMAGDDYTALDYYNKALQLDTELPAAYNQRGVIYQLHAELDSAIRDFKKATALKPDFAKAWLNLGAAYDDAKQYHHALAAYDRSLELMPGTAGTYYNIGNTCRQLGDNAAAVENYTKAIELDSNMVAAWYNRGSTYADLDDSALAKKDFNYVYDCPQSPPEARRRARLKLISLERMSNPDYVTTAGYRDFMSEAKRAARMDSLELAISLFGHAIERDSSEYLAYGMRALCYTSLEEYDSAVADWSSVLKLCPNDTVAYFQRGALYEQMKQDKNAFADYTKAIELQPTDYYVLLARGELLERSGDIQAALRDYDAILATGDVAHSGLHAAVRQAIDLLESGKKAPGIGDTPNNTALFYKAMRRLDWAAVARFIHPAELERFRDIMMPVVRSMARGSDYFMAGGNVYNIDSLTTMPAADFFVRMMNVFASEGSPLADLFDTLFFGVKTIRHLSTARMDVVALVGLNLPPTLGKGDPMDTEYLLDGEGWSLALPRSIEGMAKGMANWLQYKQQLSTDDQ